MIRWLEWGGLRLILLLRCTYSHLQFDMLHAIVLAVAPYPSSLRYAGLFKRLWRTADTEKRIQVNKRSSEMDGGMNRPGKGIFLHPRPDRHHQAATRPVPSIMESTPHFTTRFGNDWYLGSRKGTEKAPLKAVMGPGRWTSDRLRHCRTPSTPRCRLCFVSPSSSQDEKQGLITTTLNT